MIRYQRSARVLATALSALAGFVDAIGFLALGGFFVSFMSGNSTRLSVGLANGAPTALIAGGLIGAFVLGVVLGSLIGRFFKTGRAAAILVLVAALLALAAALAAMGETSAALIVVAAAMGAENTVFEREGEVSIGVTSMTGTLVKLGQRLATAVTGGPRFGWAPYLLLWLGLLAGALAGALAFPHLGLQALWIASGAALILALATLRIGV